MCTRSEAMQILSEAYEMCREIFGDKLKDAYLYGSYARGDYDEESDVDILITVDRPPEEVYGRTSLVSHINSVLSLKYDVTVSAFAEPFEQFVNNTDVLPYYRNVITEGIKL